MHSLSKWFRVAVAIVALLPVKLSLSEWLVNKSSILELLLSIHADSVLCPHLISVQVFSRRPPIAIKELRVLNVARFFGILGNLLPDSLRCVRYFNLSSARKAGSRTGCVVVTDC